MNTIRIMMGIKNNEIIKYCCIIICIFVFFSCKSNKIFFDLSNQEVVSCDKKRIHILYVTKIESQDLYIIQYNHTNNKPSFKIGLNNIPLGYEVLHKNKTIRQIDFKLERNSSYLIEFAQGDVSAQSITIFVDSNSVISSASKIDCL